MESDEADQQAGNYEDVQREEAGESRPRDNRSTQQELDGEWTNDGNTAANRCADSESPIGVLIEAQHLSAEGHAEGHQQQKHANDPGKLAGELIGAKEEDLHHVDEDDRHHEVQSPSVQSANEPAE